MPHNSFNTLKTFTPAAGKTGQYYSLPELARTFPNVKRLPVSIRIVLESVLRNVDGKKVTEEHVKQLANWAAKGSRTEEIPFILARIVLQDFTGVPVLADLAAMRNVAARVGKNPEDHRAPRPRGSRHRPLGADRQLRRPERARPQHEAGILAQPRALPVHEVGHAGVRHVQDRPARDRHRAPGEPGVPGARRLPEERHVLPRHARRHRQPHDDDQRHRRRGLGRGRHRGGSRHAGTTRVHALARTWSA
jgi:hypothetical protein